jgi:hypothetical protein
VDIAVVHLLVNMDMDMDMNGPDADELVLYSQTNHQVRRRLSLGRKSS